MHTRLRSIYALSAGKFGAPGSVRRRFANAVIWNLLASVVSRGMTLLAAVACARFLGKSGFGRFGIVLNTANMVSALASLGLGITATRYIADLRERDPDRTGRIIGLTWTITSISGVVASAITLMTARYVATTMFHAPELVTPVRISSIIIFLNAMLAFQNGALFGFEAFKGLALVNFVSGCLSLPLVLLGVWRWGLDGAVAGTAIALGVSWFLNESLLRKQCKMAGIPVRIRQGFQETAVFWGFSLPALLGSTAVATVLWVSSLFIVRSPHGFEQMGLYSAADRWRLAILFIPTALFRSALPMLSNLHEQDQQGYRRVARANLGVNMGLVLLSVITVASLSGYIMSSYGPGFRAGWPVLFIFCVGTIPEALNTILGYPLIATGRMWTRCGFDLGLSALLLVLGAWLIPSYGALGFAIAYVCTYSIISSALWLATRERDSGLNVVRASES